MLLSQHLAAASDGRKAKIVGCSPVEDVEFGANRFCAHPKSLQRRFNSHGWGPVSPFREASGVAEIPAVLSASPLLIDGVL